MQNVVLCSNCSNTIVMKFWSVLRLLVKSRDTGLRYEARLPSRICSSLSFVLRASAPPLCCHEYRWVRGTDRRLRAAAAPALLPGRWTRAGAMMGVAQQGVHKQSEQVVLAAVGGGGAGRSWASLPAAAFISSVSITLLHITS